tara:strand:+ start:29 stop:295 length:267 start_codon:yes stop_codon:yes gene_type:complete
MTTSKEELDALRRIEEALAAAGDVEPPAIGENNQENPPQEIPFNPDVIQAAESDAQDSTNQLNTIAATLESLLVEVQGIANTLQGLTE